MSSIKRCSIQTNEELNLCCLQVELLGLSTKEKQAAEPDPFSGGGTIFSSRKNLSTLGGSTRLFSQFPPPTPKPQAPQGWGGVGVGGEGGEFMYGTVNLRIYKHLVYYHPRIVRR